MCCYVRRIFLHTTKLVNIEEGVTGKDLKNEYENVYKELFIEAQDKIGNVFNRLVIFDGGLIHSGNDYFGHSRETGRLFQIFFFNEKK